MTSWRDTASEQAQVDLDGLLNAGLDLARRQIARRGGFAPFALTLGRDPEESGELVMVDDSAGDEMLEELWTALVEDSDRLRAAAYFVLVGLDEGGDGVHAGLEHTEGHALTVVAPFRRRGFPRKVVLGELQFSLGEPVIWSR